jgi:hypothetical protein
MTSTNWPAGVLSAATSRPPINLINTRREAEIEISREFARTGSRGSSEITALF